MITEPITPNVVAEKLAEILAEKGPEYRYPRALLAKEGGGGCRYTEPDGSASCIVGQMFNKIDPELLGLIHSSEYLDPDAPNHFSSSNSVEGVVTNGPLRYQRTGIHVFELGVNLTRTLGFVQGAQDSGHTYLEVIEVWNKRVDPEFRVDITPYLTTDAATE